MLHVGNNIPSDTLKAIATAVKRNVDYHTIYEEHHSKTQSMRQEIDQLQLEKSMQVCKCSSYTIMKVFEKGFRFYRFYKVV